LVGVVAPRHLFMRLARNNAVLTIVDLYRCHEAHMTTFSALFAAQQLVAHLIDSTLSLDGDLQVTAIALLWHLQHQLDRNFIFVF